MSTSTAWPIWTSGARPSRRRGSWGSRISLGLSLVVLLTIIAWSIVPDLFTSHNPLRGVTSEKLQSPSGAHLFGTDYLGRDLFARVVHGTRNSVLSSLLAVVIASAAGVVLGAVAGFLGGWVDALVSRILEVLLAIPSFLLAVLVVASFGFSTTNAAVAVGISAVPVFARLMRSEVLRIRTLPFVESSVLVGSRSATVMARHVMPNAYQSVLALAVLQFGVATLSISGLAFLGYASPPPTPEWGLLVSEGKGYLATQSTLALLPGAVIVATVLSFNRLSAVFRKVAA